MCEAPRLFSSSGCMTLWAVAAAAQHLRAFTLPTPGLPSRPALSILLYFCCLLPLLLLPLLLQFVTSSAKINRLEFAFLSLFHIARQISYIIQSSCPLPTPLLLKPLPARIVQLQLLHISSHKPPQPHCAPNPTKFSHCVSL